jgi:hypothetical protein
MTTSPTLTLEEVNVGDRLPQLTVEVTPTTVVIGALAARDWRPMHHDYAFATQRNGLPDIFFTTPNQAAWFERYITDWTGPHGRLAQLSFGMRTSVYPGHYMSFNGTITAVTTDGDTGCGWIDLEITLTTRTRVATICSAHVAVPTAVVPNPWVLRNGRWRPTPETHALA